MIIQFNNRSCRVSVKSSICELNLSYFDCSWSLSVAQSRCLLTRRADSLRSECSWFMAALSGFMLTSNMTQCGHKTKTDPCMCAYVWVYMCEGVCPRVRPTEVVLFAPFQRRKKPSPFVIAGTFPSVHSRNKQIVAIIVLGHWAK